MMFHYWHMYREETFTWIGIKRVLNRFLHRAEAVQMITGKSYRLEKSRKTSNDTKAPTGSSAEE